ncbi:MAG TPA: SDR family oxidoreductase, partial [Myxococcota bacterium]|nr:SDR family oxidoreductase [Myxococcota bacterium]
VADIDADRASKVAEALRGLGVRSLAVRTDVRSQEDVDALARRTLEELGGVDLVFNNAGVYLGGPMEDVTWDDWRFVLDVNLDGAFRVGQKFAEILRRQARESDRRGHLVNTASVGGFICGPDAVAYGASKFAVVAYSETLRMNLEPLGVGVSALCPGPIDTRLTGSDRLRAPSEKRGGTSAQLTPLTEGGMDPEEVGPIVLSGVRRNLPYIFTHDELRPIFEARFARILEGFGEIDR